MRRQDGMVPSIEPFLLHSFMHLIVPEFSLIPTDSIIPNDVIDLLDEKDTAVLERLFKKLKMGGVQPAQKEALLRTAGVEGKLTVESFAQWYLYYVFKGEEEEEDEQEREFKTDGGLGKTLVPEEGKAWRCPGCRVVNTWTTRRCIACNDLAPHADSIPLSEEEKAAQNAKPASSQFTFGVAPAGGSDSSAAAPSAFNFGAPATAKPAGGFTFAAPTPSTTAGESKNKEGEGERSKPTGGFVFAAPK